jgi:DNA modification methylase
VCLCAREAPVGLVADAVKDCSRRGEVVLDPFAGSGTTLIAGHNTGRRARLVEFDPAYCDQIVRRFEQVSGKQAILATTGQSFEVVAEERGSSLQPSTSEDHVA